MALVTPTSRVIVIAGPTASGKSDCAIELAQRIGGEIVNADTAQMYTRVSVGTAKPLDWSTHTIPHHLFDICDQPVDFDVVQYRERIVAIVSQIQARGKVPILVGGSLFYIKSLFFPPHQAKSEVSAIPASVYALTASELWQHLNTIDPARASQIHCHDTYRVMRALAIWYDSGQKPSDLVPQFQPPFPVTFVFLSPPVEQLYERINARTLRMLNEQGWIEEARNLLADDAWKNLVIRKGFIGYAALMHWLEVGAPEDQWPYLVAHIQQDTRNYAKRQRTFWNSFARQLELFKNDQCSVVSVAQGDDLFLTHLAV